MSLNTLIAKAKNEKETTGIVSVETAKKVVTHDTRHPMAACLLTANECYYLNICKRIVA